MGRDTSFKEEYCEMLEDHMGQGLSYESFAAKVGVTRDCLYKWEKRYESFLYSKKIGKERMRLLFEKMGLQAIMGKIKSFNSAVYIFTCKNKLGWSDNPDNEDEQDFDLNFIDD